MFGPTNNNNLKNDVFTKIQNNTFTHLHIKRLIRPDVHFVKLFFTTRTYENVIYTSYYN